jgi:hypothetical protein
MNLNTNILAYQANKVLQGFDEELEEEVESIIAGRYWHRYIS